MKANLKQGIIETVLELGTDLGEDAITVRGIASRLGVSATALYQHFESKAAILREIRMHGVRDLGRALMDALEDADSPQAAVIRGAHAYVDWARRNPWLYQLLMHHEGPAHRQVGGADAAELEQLQAGVRGALEERLGATLSRASAASRHLYAKAFASLHGVASLVLANQLSADHPIMPVGDIDGFIDDYITSMVDCLLPPPVGSA